MDKLSGRVLAAEVQQMMTLRFGARQQNDELRQTATIALDQ
jgi:hypothetical protein